MQITIEEFRHDYFDFLKEHADYFEIYSQFDYEFTNPLRSSIPKCLSGEICLAVYQFDDILRKVKIWSKIDSSD